jgi:DNA-binding CsgD family transcriptional regulator
MAADAAEAAMRRHRLNPHVQSLEGAAVHARGILAHSSQDLSRAVDLFEIGPRPLAFAGALEDLAGVKMEDGDTRGGVEALDRALSVTVRVGATWDSARVRRRIRAVGVRRRIVPSDRPASGWGSLTNAEIKVAELVVYGNTNRDIGRRLFISPHTVNTHLRHVFEKLNVNSRVELANVARSREN